jgi:Double-GTPase 1
LRERLPMFADFVETNWARSLLFGLSALGRPLTPESNDPDYVAQGPEAFGFVVDRDGRRASDLTIPITRLIDRERAG